MKRMWLIFAILSAVFAAATSILAKVGIDGVNVEGHSIMIDYISISADNVDEASYDITDTTF